MAVPTLKIFRKEYHVTVFLLSLIFLAHNSSSQDKGLPLRLMAYEYLQKNQMDEAEAAFQRAIKSTPDDILNYRDLAIFYLVQKKYAKSEATANAGLRLKPGNEELRSVLAKVYIQTGANMPAYNELYNILQKNNKNIFAIYNMAMLNPFGIEASRKANLINALSLAPANVVIHLSLIEVLLGSNETDSALYYMQNIKRIVPEFPPVVALSYNRVVAALQGNKVELAKNYLNRFKDVFKVTAPYVDGLSVLEGPMLSVGFADFTSNFIQNKNTSTSSFNIKFTDVSKALGITQPEGKKSSGEIIAIADYSDAGEMYIYYSSCVADGKQTCYLLVSTIGGFQPSKVEGGIEHINHDLDAVFVDYDNDGYQDLFVATTKGVLLYKKNTSGLFVFQNKNIGLNNAEYIQKMLFADFDQDGDLDMYAITNGINKFFRNNGNGTFSEQADKMGLSGKGKTSNGDYLDYDGDGDLDIITIGLNTPIRVFSNNRRSEFKDLTTPAMMKSSYKGLSVATADYNNDGLTDIFISGTSGERFLLKNINGNNFAADPLASKLITETLGNTDVRDASFFDFDNDGYMDLLVAGVNSNTSSQSIFLFHNEASKGFSNVSHLIPKELQATKIAIADFNFDGDDDIFLAGPQGVKLLRNDGGNLHQYMQVQLRGISYGSNKNNRLGIGAQVEVKAGNLYQMKTIKKAITNFGMGKLTSVDVVRIIWPNGTPQLIKDPSANERIMEEQMLKGSCPFLFVWNGERYEFFKDMMWRSALGMPLSVRGTDTTYA
ncbi:MAG: VCBS repeat-containing protein, partial [Bacteroidetes bacterium]|nr:VCBS repeat-containing protein [Bacteroidota bacterium]